MAQLEHTDAQPPSTINSAIAWHLALLTLLGRVTPEVTALPMFEESEIAVLLDYADDMKFQLPCQTHPDKSTPMEAVSLGEDLFLIALLGGYLNRKIKAPPGHQMG